MYNEVCVVPRAYRVYGYVWYVTFYVAGSVEVGRRGSTYLLIYRRDICEICYLLNMRFVLPSSIPMKAMSR